MALEDKALETTPQDTATTPQDTVAADPVYKFGGKEYKSVDEVGKAYENAQSELGKWTQQYGDLRRQYEDVSGQKKRWDEWWKTVQPLWGDDVEDVLRRKLTGQAQAAGATPQQAQQMAGQAMQQMAEQYDFYTPEGQQRFRQSLMQDIGKYANSQLAQVVNAVNQTFQQKEQWYSTYLQNHLSLLRRALEQKLRDPNFNVDAVMENAARAIAGQIDPIELGQQLITAQQFQGRLDEAKKSAYEQGKKDFEQEAKNKQQEMVPVFNTQTPTFKVPNNGTRHGLHTLREKAAQSIAKTFGPSWFTGE